MWSHNATTFGGGFLQVYQTETGSLRKLRDGAMRYSGFFSGSVKRGSDRWRFLGIFGQILCYILHTSAERKHIPIPRVAFGRSYHFFNKLANMNKSE